jgi:hypothetical protein
MYNKFLQVIFFREEIKATSATVKIMVVKDKIGDAKGVIVIAIVIAIVIEKKTEIISISY